MEINERVDVETFTLSRHNVNGINLNQISWFFCHRTRKRGMPSFPGTAFSQKPATIQGSVYRRKAHHHTSIFQLSVNNFPTSFTFVSLLDDCFHYFSLQRPWIRFRS